MPGGFSTAQVKETLFRVLFVMRDSSTFTKSAIRNTIFIFAIDMLQVLRTMLTTTYGWSMDSFRFGAWFDIVHVTGDVLIPSAIPRVSLFVGAFLLVLVAVLDALYCSSIFRAGEIRSMLPVKLLRFLVTLVVTTLYSSTVHWLLMPLECIIDDTGQNTFSELFRGDGAPCTPWNAPEIAITIPTIILIILYVSFASTACFFSLGVNILSECPRHTYTGRVELWYFATKVAITFTPFLGKHTSPILNPVVVCVCACRTLYLHLAYQPFQSHGINMLRGGTYCAVVYLAICSVVLLGWQQGEQEQEQEQEHRDNVQRAQWGCLGGIPAAFLLGFVIVHVWRQRVLQQLGRMQQDAAANTVMQPSRAGSGDLQTPSLVTRTTSFGAVLKASLAAERRTSVDTFFRQSDGQGRRGYFADGREAVTAARVLLRQRERRDQSLLAFVVQAGLAEHAECQDLKVLNITLLRSLSEGQSSAAKEERIVHSEGLPLDLQYLLYAVDRKAAQDYNAEQLGRGGGMNVVQVMEFEKKMQTARDAHLSCVTEMKSFWRGFATRKPNKDFLLKDFVNACDHVEAHHKMEEVALYEYQTLRNKYPMSLVLLYEYASFAQGVLNDMALHRDIRNEIDMLQNKIKPNGEAGGDTDSDLRLAGVVEKLEGLVAGRTSERGSSTNAPGSSSQGLVSSSVFAASFLPRRESELRRLNSVGSLLLLLLLCLSVTKYVIADHWLYGAWAERDILALNSKGMLRASAVSIIFLCRTFQLAAVHNDTAGMADVAGRISKLASRMQAQHRDNAGAAHDARLKDLYFSTRQSVMEVRGTEWRVRNLTYLEMGREVSRHAQFVSKMTREQVLGANVSARDMDGKQASMAFINENIFRAILPRMDAVMTVYIDETESVWDQTRIAIGTWTTVDLSLLVLLALLTMAFLNLVHELHACFFAVILAMSLPRTITAKLHAFYERQEKSLLECEDEWEAIRAVVEEADAIDSSNGGRKEDEEDNHESTSEKDASEEASRPNRERTRGEGMRGAGVSSGGMRVLDASVQSKVGIAQSLTERNLTLLRSASVRSGGIWGTASENEVQPSSCRGPMLEVKVDSAVCGSSATTIGISLAGPRAVETRFDPLTPLPRPRQDSADGRVSQFEVSSLASDNLKGTVISSCGDVRPGLTVSAKEGQGTAEHMCALERVGREGSWAEKRSGDIRGWLSSAIDEEAVSQNRDRATTAKRQADGGSQHASGCDDGKTDGTATPPILPLVDLELGIGSKLPEEASFGRCVEAAEREGGMGHGMAGGGLSWGETRKTLPATERNCIDAAASAAESLSRSFRTPTVRGSKSGDEDAANIRGNVSPTSGESLLSCAKRAEPERSSLRKHSLRPPSADLYSSRGGRPRPLTSTSNTIRLRRVEKADAALIVEALNQREPWILRKKTQFACLVLLFAVSILTTVFPAVRMKELVALAPTLNQVNRRRSLARSCSHLSRELVLGDRFSRMSQAETASAMRYFIDELVRTEKAVQHGGDLRVVQGVDKRKRGDAIGDVMYRDGCPWRADPTDCSTPTRPGAAAHGLHNLVEHFLLSLEDILARHRPPNTTFTSDFLTSPRAPADVAAADVWQWVDGRQQLEQDHDSNLRFVLDSFDGDLFQAMDMVVGLFDKDALRVISLAHKDNRLYFVLYTLLLLAFYAFFFRQTQRHGSRRNDFCYFFANRIPTSVLSLLEVNTVRSFMTTDALQVALPKAKQCNVLRFLPTLRGTKRKQKTPAELRRSTSSHWDRRSGHQEAFDGFSRRGSSGPGPFSKIHTPEWSIARRASSAENGGAQCGELSSAPRRLSEPFPRPAST